MNRCFFAKTDHDQNENGSRPGLTMVTLYPAFFVPFDKVKQENSQTLSRSDKMLFERPLGLRKRYKTTQRRTKNQIITGLNGIPVRFTESDHKIVKGV